LLKINPDAEMVITPSDHLILNEVEFSSVVNKAFDFIGDKNALMTIGITPTRPETGYGYIQRSKSDDICKVKCFTEKPSREIAEAFLECGEFLWNSGIFIWKVRDIIAALEEHLPEHSSLFNTMAPSLGTPDETTMVERTFAECKPISIDYGVMEKANNVYVINGDFGWSDVGTWGSAYQHLRKDRYANALGNDHIFTYNTRNTIITSRPEKVTVVNGLKDYIVVDTPDVLLICPMSDEQNIKSYIEEVRFATGDEHI
jgi:mannose-1-phosphate guanylyltransferase